MHGTDREAVAAELQEAFGALVEAMVLGDGPELEELLADDFTLTHMTGYRQPKAEWLDDLAEDRIRYHDVDVVETAVDAARIESVLTARTVTEATLWGGHGAWHLQLRVVYRRRDDVWCAAEAVTTTW